MIKKIILGISILFSTTICIFEKYLKGKSLNINDVNVLVPSMGHTLTFFKHLCENEDVAFTLLNLILNSEPHILFCIYGAFFYIANQSRKYKKDKTYTWIFFK